jgi:hypothetical protein
MRFAGVPADRAAGLVLVALQQAQHGDWVQRTVGCRRDVVRRLGVLLLDFAVGLVLLKQHLPHRGEIVEDADEAELQAGVDESVDVRRL